MSIHKRIASIVMGTMVFWFRRPSLFFNRLQLRRLNGATPPLMRTSHSSVENVWKSQ
jgi:hypothetical protein